MQDLDEFTVTDAALEQMAKTPDPRMKEIMDAAVRHLHAFARDVRLTPAEWLTGIQFLTAVGRRARRPPGVHPTGRRAGGQRAGERDARQAGARVGDAEQPARAVYREGAPDLPLGASIVADPSEPLIVVYGRVTDNDGAPIPMPWCRCGRPANTASTICRPRTLRR